MLERCVVHCWSHIRFCRKSTECNKHVINIFLNPVILEMSKNCEDLSISNKVIHIIYTNLTQLENSANLNDSTEGYIQFWSKFCCFENTRFITHLSHMWVTICVYNKLFIDKSVSSLRAGLLSPSSLCHQISHSPIT